MQDPRRRRVPFQRKVGMNITCEEGLVLGILHLHFEAQAGVEDDVDEVILDATPPLHLRFVGGVAGDEGTAAAVLRVARVIPSAPRGFITALDLPLQARPLE
jgi:hypothetical protein